MQLPNNEQPHKNLIPAYTKINGSKSNYVVNNNFHTCIQPKRISYNLRLYLQVHQKMMRKGAIEKKFQETDYKFNHHSPFSRKGFKGKVVNQTSNQYFINLVTRRVKTQHIQTTQEHYKSSDLTNSKQQRAQIGLNIETQHKSYYQKAQTSHSKPNLKYNLSLLLRNNKKIDHKRNKTLIIDTKSFSKQDFNFRLKKVHTIV